MHVVAESQDLRPQRRLTSSGQRYTEREKTSVVPLLSKRTPRLSVRGWLDLEYLRVHMRGPIPRVLIRSKELGRCIRKDRYFPKLEEPDSPRDDPGVEDPYQHTPVRSAEVQHPRAGSLGVQFLPSPCL